MLAELNTRAHAIVNADCLHPLIDAFVFYPFHENED